MHVSTNRPDFKNETRCRITPSVKCYFDKSQGVDDAGDTWLTLVGFGAPDRFWRQFDDQWRRMLWERYPIAPYIHVVARMGPFAWRATGWDHEKQSALVFDAVNLLQTQDKQTFLYPRCSLNVSGKERLVHEGYRIPDQVEICRDTCISGFYQKLYLIDKNYTERMFLYFDRGEEFAHELKRRWRANRTAPDRAPVDIEKLFWDMIGDIDELDAKYCYPLQAADMVAWGYTRGLIRTDRPYRHLAHIMERVIPNFQADITGDVMRKRNPRS